jgi:hypothetical protein
MLEEKISPLKGGNQDELLQADLLNFDRGLINAVISD